MHRLGDQLITSAAILQGDSKNYHVWSHRQWLCSRFGAFDSELAFVDRLLASDVRNNSAWNHRFFVLENTSGFTVDAIRSEIQLRMRMFTKTLMATLAFSSPIGLSSDSLTGTLWSLSTRHQITRALGITCEGSIFLGLL